MDPINPPATPPPEVELACRARTIWRRLLERVADADTTHTTIAAEAGEWQPILAGVSMKVLREHAGVLSYLLRLEPGAALPPHRHPADEECLVVDGWLRIGSRLPIGPGGYHLAHRGTLHATITTDTGATIFLRSAVPAADQVLR